MKIATAIRRTFRPANLRLVRITRHGFAWGDEVEASLTGHVTKTTLIRKLFEDGVLTCHSNDGKTGRDQRPCADCDRDLCSPQLRIHLREDQHTWLLDLHSTAASRILALADKARTQRQSLDAWTLRFTLLQHDNRVHVDIQKVPDP
jgi:hypothetical protein